MSLGNINQDIYLAEIDNKINSYKNQIDKLKCEINLIKRGNSNSSQNIYSPRNPLNCNNYSYSSINPCNKNPCSQIKNPCAQIECNTSENTKLKGLISCYEGQIKNLNDKICKLQHMLTNKEYEINEFLSEQKKKMDEEIRKQTQIISQEVCNEKINMNEKLTQQKDEFERILNCKLREKDCEFENIKKNYEREICLRENQIEELKKGNCNDLEKIQNNFDCQLKQIQCEISNKENELEKLNEKYKNNLKIISDLFYFFQQNVNLFNNSGVINCDGDDIKYDENDPNKNIQCSNFIFTTINNFICKILKDNKEMYDLLLNYKNVIAKNEEENEQMINQNNCLKGQLCDLVNQLSQNTQNQTLNRETIDVTNNEYNRSIDYDGPIKDLKSRINKLEKTIKNQEYD